ncbi:F-box protein At5g18160-like [Ananas comosus]|uniref:F-box protein At5g18160-like n=1 Tax=Ananas comosus TaxID=4615 RepID=A0A6P5GD38_ANACO|nr:F-box protein At5g18160-like [Ananas comosus]XP_020106519.1 F-box protein At5g18160-like [Ananas comosus]XP_020106520.1 F-box protein At5g18160-like [Ananas comosus]XP_020106521.1 F-box protein At5g18160-like [Ananas comosus]
MTVWDSDRKRMRIETTDQQQKETPYEIIQEILSRLPTRAVLRSGLVSKLWFSAASNAYFRSLHYSRMGPDPKPVILLLGDSKKGVTSSGPARIRRGGHIPLYHLSAPQNYELCNTCNGLLCLAPRNPAEPIIVCNPLTDESVALPAAPPPMEDCYCFVGLGFCSTSNGYKVFRISYPREGNYVALRATGGAGVLEVCDVGCNESWRRVCRLLLPPFGKPVCVDGKIHWVAHSHISEDEILSVDVCSEKYIYTTIPSVAHCGRRELSHYGTEGFAPIILEMEGCVSIAAHYHFSGLFIWVLKDLQQNRWELRHSCFPLLPPFTCAVAYTQEIVNVCFYDGILLLRLRHQLRHQCVMYDTREHSSTVPPRGWRVDVSEILSITEGELIGGFYPSLVPAKEFASCSSRSSKMCRSEDSWFPCEVLNMKENKASALARYVLRGKAWNGHLYPSVVVNTSLRFL